MHLNSSRDYRFSNILNQNMLLSYSTLESIDFICRSWHRVSAFMLGFWPFGWVLDTNLNGSLFRWNKCIRGQFDSSFINYKSSGLLWLRHRWQMLLRSEFLVTCKFSRYCIAHDLLNSGYFYSHVFRKFPLYGFVSCIFTILFFIFKLESKIVRVV